MTAWAGWAAAAYLAGALVLALAADNDVGSKWHRGEFAALLGWPLTIPVLWTWGTIRNRRRTCRTCNRRYRDRAAMLRHIERGHEDRLPAPPPAQR